MKSKSPQPYLRNHDSGTTISITVQPNAPVTKIKGLYGDTLKVQLKAPPVDGKANEELIRFLSKLLGLRQAEIEILSGETSRKKRVLIHLAISEVMAKMP